MKFKRDMDLIRELLLQIEDGKTAFETTSTEEAEFLGGIESAASMDQEAADRLRYHLDLLENGGLAEIHRAGGGIYYVEKITWKGQEYLASVRDPEVWQKPKAAAKQAGAGTLDLVCGIAKEIAKAEVKRHTGLDL